MLTPSVSSIRTACHRALVARALVAFTAIGLLAGPSLSAGAARSAGGRSTVQSADLKEWLSFLASDALEGRDTFSEGLGIAAEYITEHLREWGLKPAGDNGTYFQRVAVQGIKITDHSTVTIETGGQSRTFKAGEGFTIPGIAGGKQTLKLDGVEFLGYGISASGEDDYAGLNLKGKLAVWLGGQGPSTLPATGRRLLGSRGRSATAEHGAAAGLGPEGPAFTRRPNAAAGPARTEAPDTTTVNRLDLTHPPVLSAKDDLLEFLFSAQDVKYADLKAKATAREVLPRFTLKDVKVTIDVNSDYRVVRTQYTRNVVAVVEGRDPKLKDTYVAYGAHYDHVGYAEGEVTDTDNGPRRGDARGKVTAGAEQHRIWNGADDDGSGTVTLLGLAKAYAKGPRARRSILFVWHAGEERGLYGSRYFADNPTIPLEKIVAQVNVDMIGRNRDNKTEEENTVYLVGADRISTELHNLTVDANARLATPLKLDYENNDPSDPEQIYYRSDHYSYAAKGIPIVFLTTGLHPDYHANTDTVDRIDFGKMAHIGQLAYEIGHTLANLDHAPVRDNKGPRTGKSATGKLN